MMLPIFSILFIILILISVVLSIEDLLVWLIAIVFIYRIIKYCTNNAIDTRSKLKYSIVNTLIPILSIFVLNKVFVLGTKFLLG